ncbi:hypothetical protein CTEN210_05086 [Chaetoceros tenuissimus]|uniref:HSF-type DNA-binding domain-containing protein n=1 Tax=Chaetoceros tenuissimus TaxID=426638 RepID=A0AAD3CP12_9STRA|nr:hypothetical protein CTEN210_05086 [Chaetoceros tenuissimus]
MDRHQQLQQQKDQRASSYSFNHPSAFNHPETTVAHVNDDTARHDDNVRNMRTTDKKRIASSSSHTSPTAFATHNNYNHHKQQKDQRASTYSCNHSSAVNHPSAFNHLSAFHHPDTSIVHDDEIARYNDTAWHDNNDRNTRVSDKKRSTSSSSHTQPPAFAPHNNYNHHQQQKDQRASTYSYYHSSALNHPETSVAHVNNKTAHYDDDDRNMRATDKKRSASSRSHTPPTAFATHNMDRHQQLQQQKDQRASSYSFNHPSAVNHPETSVASDHAIARYDDDDDRNMLISDEKRIATSSSHMSPTAFATHNNYNYQQLQQQKDQRASSYSFHHPSAVNHPDTSVANDHAIARYDDDDRITRVSSKKMSASSSSHMPPTAFATHNMDRHQQLQPQQKDQRASTYSYNHSSVVNHPETSVANDHAIARYDDDDRNTRVSNKKMSASSSSHTQPPYFTSDNIDRHQQLQPQQKDQRASSYSCNHSSAVNHPETSVANDHAIARYDDDDRNMRTTDKKRSASSSSHTSPTALAPHNNYNHHQQQKDHRASTYSYNHPYNINDSASCLGAIPDKVHVETIRAYTSQKDQNKSIEPNRDHIQYRHLHQHPNRYDGRNDCESSHDELKMSLLEKSSSRSQTPLETSPTNKYCYHNPKLDQRAPSYSLNPPGSNYSLPDTYDRYFNTTFLTDPKNVEKSKERMMSSQIFLRGKIAATRAHVEALENVETQLNVKGDIPMTSKSNLLQCDIFEQRQSNQADTFQQSDFSYEMIPDSADLLIPDSSSRKKEEEMRQRTNQPNSEFERTQKQILTERQDTNCFPNNAFIDVQGRERDVNKTHFKAIRSRDKASSNEVHQHTRSDLRNNTSNVTIPGSNTFARLYSPVDTTCSSISSKETANLSSTLFQAPGRPSMYHDLGKVSDSSVSLRTKKGDPDQIFPLKLFRLLECESNDSPDAIVSWILEGRAFIVRKPERFIKEIMPKYFDQTKFSSFQKQIYLYGFCLIKKGVGSGGYRHDLFRRDSPHLCMKMVRKK